MYVPIGGIEQWVTIHGENRRNPIILVVHGGPGNPLSPVGRALFQSWETDFTVVQWDQRGAGRTFTRNGADASLPMTIARMAQDGVELADYLRARMGQRKVILFATSWGSVLATHMIHERPDLFHAYVGHSQVVAWDDNLSATYQRVLDAARAAQDQASIDTLTELGPPPWSNVRLWPRFRRVYVQYQRAATTATPVTYVLDPQYGSEEEQAQYSAAEDYSFEHLWGMTLAGPLTEVDLRSLGADFGVPLYIVQGERDLWTVPDLARSYFDAINAPSKEFILVEGAGHDFTTNGMATIHQVLLERVRPLAVAPD